MKKILLICLLSVSLFSQAVYTVKDIIMKDGTAINANTKELINGVVRLYYKTGELKKEVIHKDGKKHGTVKEYYKNGNLKIEGQFKDGFPNGISKLYYKNGNLKNEVTINEKINMIRKDYYETGKLRREIVIKDGKPTKGFLYTKEGKKTKMTNAHFHNMGLNKYNLTP